MSILLLLAQLTLTALASLSHYEYFVDEPSYRWISVDRVEDGTASASLKWTDGANTWFGEPGCWSADMPAGCVLVASPVAPTPPTALEVK